MEPEADAGRRCGLERAGELRRFFVSMWTDFGANNGLASIRAAAYAISPLMHNHILT